MPSTPSDDSHVRVRGGNAIHCESGWNAAKRVQVPTWEKSSKIEDSHAVQYDLHDSP